MGRPKRERKPSQRALARRARKAAGGLTVTTGTSSVATLHYYRPRVIVIESLDEGATWHTTGTVEPAVNLNGELMIGSAPWGAAPECMRPGSGTYRFEVVMRGATEEEAATWIAAHPPPPPPTEAELAEMQANAEATRAAAEEFNEQAAAQARGGRGEGEGVAPVAPVGVAAARLR